MFATDAHTGRRFGKYEVLCRLSGGGMASIFLARQHGPVGFQKIVVLKQILPNIASEPEYVRLFVNEARITARFAHPNIAYVYDLDASPEHGLYLVMEFIEGASLLELWRTSMQRNQALPPGFSLAVARDVAHALHYAHTFVDAAGVQRSVTHRDVAEKNIMVSFGGVTKLLDFGIAKGRGQRTTTTVGHVRGTVGYMSPEYIRGAEPDGRSDVFGLGVALYEVLANRSLYPGMDASERIKATLKLNPEPPSKFNPQLPPEADAVVLKALALDPNARYTADALAQALSALPGLFTQAQSAEVVARLFAERRTQTRAFLMELGAGEGTGDVDLSALSKAAGLEPLEALATPSPTAGANKPVSDSRAVTLSDDDEEVEQKPGPPTEVSGSTVATRPARSSFKIAALAAVAVVALGVVVLFVARKTSPAESGLPPPVALAPLPAARETPPPPTVPPEPVIDAPPTLELVPNDGPDAAQPTRAPPRPTATPKPRPPVAAPAPAPPAARTGFLSLVTRPYAQVALKGRALGVTPLHHVQLPAGHHTLALSSDEAGARYLGVDIRPGEETEVRALLSELKTSP